MPLAAQILSLAQAPAVGSGSGLSSGQEPVAGLAENSHKAAVMIRLLRSPSLGASPLLVGAFFGLTGVPEARADEPEPEFHVDEGAYPPPAVRRNVLIGGVAVTGASYGLAVGASYLWENDPGAADLRLPFVGPWLKVSQTALCADLEDSFGCSDVSQVLGAVMAGFSGLGQIAGLPLILEGIFMTTASPARPTESAWGPTGSTVGRDWTTTPFMVRRGDFSMAWLPAGGPGGDLSLSLVGTF